jgi:hypothetical protein
VSPEISDPIPPLNPAAPLSVPASPPEVVADRRLAKVPLDGGFLVAARDALPKFIDWVLPLLNPPIFETLELRVGVVLAVLVGTDGRPGSPGNL